MPARSRLSLSLVGVPDLSETQHGMPHRGAASDDLQSIAVRGCTVECRGREPTQGVGEAATTPFMQRGEPPCAVWRSHGLDGLRTLMGGSETIRILKAVVLALSDDDVIQDGDPKELSRLNQSSREFAVFCARGRVSAGMVVSQNQTHGVHDDGGLEGFARMHD